MQVLIRILSVKIRVYDVTRQHNVCPKLLLLQFLIRTGMGDIQRPGKRE